MRFATYLVFLVSVAAPLRAQSVPGRLRVGEGIGLVAQGARGLDATASSIRLDRPERMDPVGRAYADYTRITDLFARNSEIQSARGRNAGIGALIGVGVGGIAGLLGASEFCSGSSSCGSKQYIAGFLLGGVAGAGVGALVGAVTGSS